MRLCSSCQPCLTTFLIWHSSGIIQTNSQLLLNNAGLSSRCPNLHLRPPFAVSFRPKGESSQARGLWLPGLVHSLSFPLSLYKATGVSGVQRSLIDFIYPSSSSFILKTHPVTHSLIKYLWGTYCIPSTGLSPGIAGGCWGSLSIKVQYDGVRRWFRNQMQSCLQKQTR